MEQQSVTKAGGDQVSHRKKQKKKKQKEKQKQKRKDPTKRIRDPNRQLEWASARQSSGFRAASKETKTLDGKAGADSRP